MGKLNVIDNLADGVFYLVWMFYILSWMEVQTGIAVKSLFSLGATGTLVFGLASKDIATQLMSGLTLHLSDKIFEVCFLNALLITTYAYLTPCMSLLHVKS